MFVTQSTDLLLCFFFALISLPPNDADPSSLPMTTTIPSERRPLPPELARHLGVAVDSAGMTVRLRRPLLVRLLLLLLFAATLAGTGWVIYLMATEPAAVTLTVPAHDSTGKPISGETVTVSRPTHRGQVLAFGVLLLAGLGYALLRRVSIRLGEEGFSRRVRVFGWDRVQPLRPDTPLSIDYVDDGNGTGHHRLRARGTGRSRLGPILHPRRPGSEIQWVTLWYDKDVALVTELRDWLTACQGLPSPPEPEPEPEPGEELRSCS